MNLLNISRQRLAGLMTILLLMLLLAACGTPANAASSGSSQGTSAQQTQQRQPTSSNATTSSAKSGMRSTDQQVQSLLRQLDGAQGDVNNADAGATQDSGQP